MNKSFWVWIAFACLSIQAAAAERTAHYEEALARAQASGSDIVVFQRGSDWNRLGEILYQEVWLQEEFARELGDRFVLVAVDYPEREGAPALRGPWLAKAASEADGREQDSPRRLAERTGPTTALPVSEIGSIETKEGTIFKPRADGAWLAEGANPGQETIALQIKTAGGGQILRLDFPTDPSLPGNGPGRASNGNFAVCEVEVRLGEKPLRVTAAWADAGDGAWRTVDGVSDKADQVWNAFGHFHERRTLLLTLAEPVPAGAELNARLICRSPWGQHVPGCLRAAVVNEPPLATDVAAVANAQALRARNNTFTWWDTTYCPRIALLDSAGRAVASENKPRLGLTPLSLALRVKALRAVREQRDALWARAEAAQGPERAELLRQSLDLLGFANWPGNGNCYQFVHDQIREADPQDKSGAVRWLGFGGDPRDGVPWAEPSWAKALEKPELVDADFEEALARIDKELQDARNRVLDHERIQRMMIAKYHVYLRWPKHEEQRFDVQREIAAFDPDTFWGIGARGELGLRHRTAKPMLTYGWAAGQVGSGLNAWDITDTAYFFDHAGTYTVRLTRTGGQHALHIRRIALLDGAAVLAEARPEAAIGPPNAFVEAVLDLKEWSAGRKFTLRVEAEAAEGETDISGQFSVEPQLPPAPPVPASAAAGAAKLDIAALRQRLSDQLSAAANNEAGALRAVESPELQAALAQAELIRVCGAGAMAALAEREGGEAFLQSLLQETNWVESFLTSGKADWPQALENLYLLRRHEPAWEGSLEKNLATAIALKWGKGSPYRMVDRFRQIRQALKDGLMHVSFEGLDVRGMRWAVPNYGSAYDFQFLLDDRQTRLGDYLGAHGGIRYVSFNVYGLTVQDQWNYVGPWAHVYGNGTGHRPFPAHKRVGGVCGTVSTYGSATAQVHGIPSTDIGQPGHCAYIVRMGQEWPVGNSVTWPSHTSVPGWDGTGYPTLHRLYEPVYQDREPFMQATRLGWLARLQADRAVAQVRIVPGLRCSLYLNGVGAGLPDFSKLVPNRVLTTDTIDLAAVQPNPPINFGLVWEGEMEVHGSGPVRMSVQSDDGSRLSVDGQVLVEANCNRQEREISLAEGRHALRVEFCQGGGALGLSVGMAGALTALDADWRRTYEQAIAAQPTNYGIWIDYLAMLETVKDLPAANWLALASRAAHDLAPAHEAGWAITRRCLEKVLPGLPPADRLEYLTACHRSLRQELWVKPEAFPYDGLLNWQADSIGDPTLAVEFYRRLLDIHYSLKPEHNWIFGTVLGWGASRFASQSATSAGYARAMESFFQARGDSLDKNLLANTLATGIRKSGEANDLVSFRLWSDMAVKMLPPLKPEDVHLSPAQAAAAPKWDRFPGDLVSQDGLLRTSSASQFDRPFSYGQVLSGGFGGWFDTHNEERPWAQVQLPGETELSGIVLVNRYEYPPEHEEFHWAAPLKVMASLDGQNWAEVAKFEKAEAVFRIDLAGKAIKARYVRIERLPGDDKTKPPGRFHFRNFLVYGKKLY